MTRFLITAAFAALAAPALAGGHVDVSGLKGDPAAGEEQFNRQCVTCHVIVDDAGETIAGRNMRTGPNLYGVAYRTIGSHPDFEGKYSDALVTLGENGGIWTQADFVGFVQGPTPWVREALDDRRARGKMSYQVRDEQQAYDLFAYLASVGPELTEEQQAALEADTAE